MWSELQKQFPLVNASLIDLLKHLAIVAIVDVNSNKNWIRSIECLFQHRGNSIREGIISPLAPNASAYLTVGAARNHDDL
jgi:hypothetical protein